MNEREQMELNKLLMNSSQGVNIQQITELIEAGADVNAVNEFGQTPLHKSAKLGRREVVELLLDRGANVNAVDEFGKTPLHKAAVLNHREVVKLLLDRGANINAVTIEGKETPLCIAASLGFREVVELLLDRGANINVVERRGWTPLHAATRGGNRGVVELLLDRGANVNAVDNIGMTPLHFTLKYGQEELVGLLLEKGASVNAVDKKGMTPLSIVASDYQIRYYDEIILVGTIIAYAVLHSDTTTKPECIVENSELFKLWDYYQNEMMNVKLGNSTISLYKFLRETDENKLAGYLSNEESGIRSYLEAKQYENECPEYTNVIVDKFKKALERKDLLYISDIVMDHSDDLKKFSREVKGEITNYLENEDLRNVIKAPFSAPNQNLDNPNAEQLQAPAQTRK